MKRTVQQMTMVAGMLAFAFGCGGGTPERAGEVFRYRLASDPPSIDPAHVTDTTSATLAFRMFESLIEQDPATLQLVPVIAESWEVSGDGLTYTFHLKHGITFHNGREVTADDFRWSFERILTPATRSERAWVLRPITGADEMLAGRTDTLSGMEIPDPYTVVLHLDEPFTPFIEYLAMEAAFAVAHESVESGRFTPIGTGPYKFVSWDHDIRVRLERWEGYHGDIANIPQIEYEIIPDVGVAFQKFINGELDFLDEIPTGQLQLITGRYPDAVRSWPYLRIEYIGINHTIEPFKGNPALRQALAYAVDRDAIVNGIKEGASVIPTGVLPPGIPGKNEDIEGYRYDPDRARELLAEAGYPGGQGLRELSLWYNTNESHQQVAQLIQQNFRDIGVTVHLKSLDWAAYLTACENQEPDLYRLGWVADIPDADNFLFTLLHSSQIGPPGNYSGYSNPEFDRLVAEARQVLDPDRRNELYSRAEKIATEDVCWIIYGYNRESIMLNPAYEGLVQAPQGDFRIPIQRLRLRAE